MFHVIALPEYDVSLLVDARTRQVMDANDWAVVSLLPILGVLTDEVEVHNFGHTRYFLPTGTGEEVLTTQNPKVLRKIRSRKWAEVSDRARDIMRAGGRGVALGS